MIVAESARLLLRKIEPGDFAFLFGLFMSPEVMKFYDGLRDERQTLSWIESNLESYEKHGFGKWIVLRKSDGVPLGHCGFQPVQVDGIDELELGYFLDQSYWRQGFATEAGKLAVSIAFDRLGRNRVVSTIDPRNVASLATARRLGMSREKTASVRSGKIHWTADVYAVGRNSSSKCLD